MPLQKQVIDVPLAENIDTHSDPKQAINPSALENAVVTRSGEVEKRQAFQAVTVTAPTSVIMPVCHGIFEYNNKPVLIVEGRGNGTGANAAPTAMFYSPIEAGTYWYPANEAGLPFSLKRYLLSRKLALTDQRSSIDYSGNYCAILRYNDTDTTARLEIWDHTTGVLLHEQSAFTTLSFVGLKFIDDPTSGSILFAVGYAASFNLRLITWRTATPTTAPTAETNLAVTNTEKSTGALAAISTLYNVANSKLDLVVAFKDSSDRLNVEAITGSNTSRWVNTYATATYDIPETDIAIINVNALSDSSKRLIIAYDAIVTATRTLLTVAVGADGTSLTATPNTVSVTAVASSLMLTGSGSFVGTGGQVYTNTVSESNIFVLVSQQSVNNCQVYYLDNNGARTGSEMILYNAKAMSDAFEYKGRNFFVAAYESSTTVFGVNEYLLYEVTRGTATTGPRVVGRLNVSSGASIPPGRLAPVAIKSTGVFCLLLPQVLDVIGSITAYNIEAIGLAVFEFNLATPRAQIAVSGPDRLITLGRVWLYDGGAQELGFDWLPLIGTITTPAVATSLGAGTYSVRSTYEWFDRHGQRHISAPSTAVTAVTVAGDSLVAPVYTAPRGEPAKALSTKLVGYRSAVDGSVHYMDTNSGLYTANDVTTASVSLTMTNADSAATANEALYTEGGQLDNIAPPASNIVLAHKNRVYLVPSEDRTAVWFSKERLSGVGLSFSDLLVLRCAEGGDITALGYVDDYRIICKADSLYAFAGPGPNAQGFGAFTDIQRISSDVGVRDPNSVVSFSGGMMFKASRGFYILDRSMQTSFVGVGLENISGLTQSECVSAVHMPEKSRIYFIHADIRTIAVFDYLHKLWTTFELPSATFSANFAGGVSIRGVLYLAEADGTLWKLDESSGIYDESPSGYTFAVTTPWIRTAGVQGFQRVWWAHLTGVFPTSGTVTVKIYYDDDAGTVAQTVTQTLSASTGSELRIKPSRQKCASIRMRIEYVGTAAFKLSKTSLVCGVKGGKLNRLKAAATK